MIEPRVSEEDRRDLLRVLAARFGKGRSRDPEVLAAVAAVSRLEQLDLLVLAAANARSWEDFWAALGGPRQRLTGPAFDPLA